MNQSVAQSIELTKCYPLEKEQNKSINKTKLKVCVCTPLGQLAGHALFYLCYINFAGSLWLQQQPCHNEAVIWLCLLASVKPFPRLQSLSTWWMCISCTCTVGYIFPASSEM